MHMLAFSFSFWCYNQAVFEGSSHCPPWFPIMPIVLTSNPSSAVTSTAACQCASGLFELALLILPCRILQQKLTLTANPTTPSFWMAGKEVEFSSCVFMYMSCCVVLFYTNKCKCNLIFNKFRQECKDRNRVFIYKLSLYWKCILPANPV